MRLSALLLLLAAQLPALGSSVTWLGGTQPFETVPHREADWKLAWGSGSGLPYYGFGADVGFTDRLMLQTWWDSYTERGTDQANFAARYKLMQTDYRGFGLSATGGIAYQGGDAGQGQIGFIGSWDVSDAVFVVNGSRLLPTDAWTLSTGTWTPYVAYFLRPGLEWGMQYLGGRQVQWLLPQLALNLGGDLSIDLGCRFQLQDPRDWRVLTRLSYQLFPNP